jgi:hypothetical protein
MLLALRLRGRGYVLLLALMLREGGRKGLSSLVLQVGLLDLRM